MKVSISDFARSRGVERTAVNAWIRNHDEVNSECEMVGKEKYIDDQSDAFQLLEKQYPFPAPVQIINHDPEDEEEIRRLRAQVDLLHARLDQVNEENREQLLRLTKLENTQLLLEQKSVDLEKREEEVSALLQQLADAVSEREKAVLEASRLSGDLKHAEEEIAAKNAEFDAFNGLNIFQKAFHKFIRVK